MGKNFSAGKTTETLRGIFRKSDLVGEQIFLVVRHANSVGKRFSGVVTGGCECSAMIDRHSGPGPNQITTKCFAQVT